VVRDYRSSDLEAVVRVFQRSVREVASRDYLSTQISAWAPEHPDGEAWARRLETGGVFVYERNDEIAGFVRIDCTGCSTSSLYTPRFNARVLPARCLIELFPGL
jgi:putative acetyltransferase